MCSKIKHFELWYCVLVCNYQS